MYRKLLRPEPEVIACVAKDFQTYYEWLRENDFHDIKNIKWIYVDAIYKICGVKFTMLFLIEDFWRMPDFGLITRHIHQNMEQYGIKRVRTFSTLEGVEHNFERR